MEKLAQTCKILYDKEYLDNIMLLKEKEQHPVVIFKDIFEYFNQVKKFQIKIKNFVKDRLNNNEMWDELYDNIDNVTDHHLFIKNLRKELIKELFIFTQKKEKKWCNETATIFIHAVKGSIKGLTLCFSNNYEDITKEFIKNMTLSTIFHMIGTHEEYQGIFDKISYFKCEGCNKIRNEVIYADKLLCMKCFT
tara:strand:+ start:14030 stop:14608 length:579 start_codon:yes stop_codon:yes gene_type:complete